MSYENIEKLSAVLKDEKTSALQRSIAAGEKQLSELLKKLSEMEAAAAARRAEEDARKKEEEAAAARAAAEAERARQEAEETAAAAERQKAEEAAAAEAARKAPAPEPQPAPSVEQLLAEIRDLLKAQKESEAAPQEKDKE